MQGRELTWRALSEPWDVLIVGGGVTGAGILLEAARRGWRALLVDRDDFASGTSSRSSKLVHGGLRYLKEGRIGLTRESVREREALLRSAPGLVEPIPFLFPHYAGGKPGRLTMALGLTLYDALAGHRRHRYVDRDKALKLSPFLASDGLTGAHLYMDATTDDARLVLRLLQEAREAGGLALNYVEARSLIRNGKNVTGATLRDTLRERQLDVTAGVVINATGASADALRAAVGEAPRMRPLRGSHVILPDWKLPLAQAVAFSHPRDGRPVFAYPWLGATLVGTTDLDHDTSLRDEPAIRRAEVDYLLAAVCDRFPNRSIAERDIVSTFAGVRPVISSGKMDPSREAREHVVWREHGLLTVTGGKLTTFRPMALEALRVAAPHVRRGVRDRSSHAFAPCAELEAPGLLPEARRRLSGRYGKRAQDVVAAAAPGDFESVASTDTLWAEVRYAARNEAVEKLDDLLLRRTRIGLLRAWGGTSLFPRL